MDVNPYELKNLKPKTGVAESTVGCVSWAMMTANNLAFSDEVFTETSAIYSDSVITQYAA